MIKANVKVSCRVNGSASVNTAHDGSQFVSIPCIATIRDRNGQTMEQTLSISCDPLNALPQFITIGSRIEAEGDMYFRRRADNLYVNMRASKVNINPKSVLDSIEGTITVKGKAGEKISERNDKKGRPMVMFSVYSSEKVDDGYEYTWVSCTAFNTKKPDWLRHKEIVDLTGSLELGTYAGNLSIRCTCREISQPPMQQ